MWYWRNREKELPSEEPWGAHSRRATSRWIITVKAVKQGVSTRLSSTGEVML